MGLLRIIYKYTSKKIKASSLTEILVATTLILLVFGIAIATLNNILTSFTKYNTQAIETELSDLQYQYIHNTIKIPYHTESNEWNISVTKQVENNRSFILFEATNQQTKKKCTKKLIAIENN